MIPSTVSSIGSTWIRLPYFTSGQGWMLQNKKTPVRAGLAPQCYTWTRKDMPLPRKEHPKTIKSPGETSYSHRNISALTKQKSYPPKASLHSIHLPSLLSALSKTTGEFNSFFLPFCSSADAPSTFTHLECSLKTGESHRVAFILARYWRTSCKEK